MVITQLEAKKYQAFYTKSTPIVDYMVSKLALKPTDRVLEPCGGDGVLVEAILANNVLAKIDVCELNDHAYQTLLNKFSHYPFVNIKQMDTLFNSDLIFNSDFGNISYDKIIANPPYGAWQDLDQRKVLKKLYPNIYTKETYTLFLYRCIELLKEGGILSFIIPDTFLNLHTHKAIRQYILTKTKILELALFPSSFFPNVNFGYANLAIITLQKSNDKINCLNNTFKVLTAFSNVKQLSVIKESELKIFVFSQEEVLSNPDYAFLITDNTKASKIINHSNLNIGDIADCVTGFYSGNDKIFLQVKEFYLKNSRNYNLVNMESINRNYKNTLDILDGIEGKQSFLPIVKGGNVKYLKPEDWFINWSKEAVAHYKKDKKARFQNSQYYFRFGVGVPMVSSSSITASLIKNKLFDQSIVGIFPKDISLVYYLLAFFNSPTCNKLIRIINPSANNSANYIKKIPFIEPTHQQKTIIEQKVKIILDDIERIGKYNKILEIELNDAIKMIYGF